MSKRKGKPEMPEKNVPASKKLKLNETKSLESMQLDEPSSSARQLSPVPGPSSAPSDPELQAYSIGLIPMCRYFNPTRLDEGSSQGSTSNTDIGTSTTDTTSSTNVEVGDSRSDSVEDMDVGKLSLDARTSESSSSSTSRPRRMHKSRRCSSK